MTDEEYEEIIEEALVDTYGDYEQIEGFAAFLDDAVSLPLEGTIAGTAVTIVEFEARGTRIVAIVKKGRDKYPIDLMSIDFPHATLPIEAYKRWRTGW